MAGRCAAANGLDAGSMAPQSDAVEEEEQDARHQPVRRKVNQAEAR